MERIVVSKESIRSLIHRKRVPRKLSMVLAGSYLYDVLKNNGLHEKIHLWSMCYWVRARSLNAKQAALTFEAQRSNV